jgi:periplasmic divalent cation tolerance protein
MKDEYVIALTTLPADDRAPGIARTLVEERLAACVNILPAMTSVYRWKDAVEQDPEHQLVMKTTRARIPALWKRLRELHPYDVPEFIVVPVIDGHEAYLTWIGESTAAAPATGESR